MNYKEKVIALLRNKELSDEQKEMLEKIFPELKESEDEKARKGIIDYVTLYKDSLVEDEYKSWIYWLEKQGAKANPYSGVSFELNGNIWGMCARDNGVDILLNKQLFKHLEKQDESIDKGEISDGYHTFNELYYYRMLYNAAFFNLLPKEWVHKSKKHHDGEECFGGGWFIVMAELPTGQISNHYELKDWDLFDIPEKEIADEWDGHTPQEAAERIHKFLLEKQNEQESLCDKLEKAIRKLDINGN